MIKERIIYPQPHSETPSSFASKPRMACFGLLGMDVQARQERVVRTSGQGEAPWLLLGSGINSNTPSVRDDGMVVSGGGGGIPFTVPVTGMYFVHSDHLGSVSFLTNGRGAIIAGGEFGGKSDIQYKPYGEIDRPHSSGPDISKYKYTGQEEDKESGLLYYKARYYDPGLGRFAQADSMVQPDSAFGMNRYMYVDASPTNFADTTENSRSKSTTQKITEYFMLTQLLSGHDPSELQDSLTKHYVFYTHIKTQGKGKQFDNSFFVKGHNYSGSGNKDPFDGFFSWNRNTKEDRLIYLAYISNSLEIPLEHAISFYFLLPLLRPHAKGYMDAVAIKHDDESPLSAGKFTSSKNSWKIVEADARYIQRFGDGLIKGKLNLREFAIGLNGSLLFATTSMPLHATYAAVKGTMEETSRFSKRLKKIKVKL
jgi:RHS repeat-associated protein